MPPISEIHPKARYVLGVDLARLGEDSSVYIVIEQPYDDDDLYVVYIEETRHKLLTDAINRIRFLNSRFKFQKVIIDETGLGAGVADVLQEDSALAGKVDAKTFTIKLKQDIYSNLRALLEKRARNKPGGLHIPDHQKLIYQLADLRYEVVGSKDGQTKHGNLKIHHSEKGHDDFPDALALAASGFKVGTTKAIYWGVH